MEQSFEELYSLKKNESHYLDFIKDYSSLMEKFGRSLV